MAITIRNKTTEELIRKIGRRTGEGPSAVLRRLAEAEISRQDEQRVAKEEVERRLRLFSDLAKEFPPPVPAPTWEDVETEMDSLYDYLEEGPRPQSKRKHA